MDNCRFLCTLLVGSCLAGHSGDVAGVAQVPPPVFSSAADNDLYRVLSDCGLKCPRCNSPAAAIEAAPEGAGVLLLADQYPRQAQEIPTAVFDLAAKKRLRVYVEYPASLPGVEVGKPQATKWERGVVASDAFGASLKPMRIAAIHDCHFVPVAAEKPHMVIARVAGFDTALYGLPRKDVWPILFEHPGRKMLVSTTKLSQFVTARYAPTDAWGPVWKMILEWVQPGLSLPELKWTPSVRPSYARDELLPADAERQAIRRGNEWVLKSRMLIHPSWRTAEWGSGPKQSRFVVEFGEARNTSLRFSLPAGDGSCGILEGFQSKIHYDGSQAVRWSLRTDCTGEHVAPFVLAGRLLNEPRWIEIGKNLADFVLFTFDAKAPWNTPSNPAYGLIGWACPPTMAEPIDQTNALYGVISARTCMSTLAAATVLDESRWDDRALQVMLANFRTTGRLGFRETAIRRTALEEKGWQHYYARPTLNLGSHPTAQLLAANLMAYKASGYRPLLDRTERALRLLMEAYPDKLKWWNGLQQERGRLLLPLAWLIRADDTPEHRAWLQRVVGDFLGSQVACGAVREELGAAERGVYGAPASNEAYGTKETSLIQNNGDPVCDLLYTINSGFLGLHEAAAATGSAELRKAEDRLAAFLCRIQTRSDTHPDLDGTWFRAFDYGRWDYWASNADLGWGAWCVETGWVQGWLVTTFALRQMNTTLWDLDTQRPLAVHLDKNLKQLLPEDELKRCEPPFPHAALDKPVTLAIQPDRGSGPMVLVDGFEQEGTELDNQSWLAFHATDLDATIDLGEPLRIQSLAAHFLQQTKIGIFLPREVEFAVSADGQSFDVVATRTPNVSKDVPGPLTRTMALEGLDRKARFVRVRAKNAGSGGKGWLFVGEILVNPSPKKQDPQNTHCGGGPGPSRQATAFRPTGGLAWNPGPDGREVPHVPGPGLW